MKAATIRASSLARMFDCAHRWAAEHLEGRRLPSTGPAHLGTSIHHASGRFDQARMEGSPIAVADAADLFLHELRNPKDEVRWERDLTQKRAADVGVQLVRSYCNDISPQTEFASVEMQLQPLVVNVETEGVTLTLTGQADRVRKQVSEPENFFEEPVERRGVDDLKSGKRIVSADGTVSVDKHIAQLGQYELLETMVARDTGVEMSLPARIIAIPTGGNHTEIITQEVDKPSRILLGDEKNPGLLTYAANMISTERFPGNVHSQLCSEKYCPVYKTCFYRGQS